MFEEFEFLEVCLHSFLSKYNILGDYKSTKTELFEVDINKVKKWLEKCKQFRLNAFIDD